MQKLSHFSIHKNHRILIAASAVAMLAGISSCSDYDNGYDDKTLAYKESFIEAFGTIDPNHTWNMAQSCTVDVTINLPGVFTVKVWTADPRMKGTNSYLLGKYENVQSGSAHSFQCDIPSTVETAYVGAIDEEGNRFVVSAEVKNGKVKATIGAEGSRLVVGATGGTVEVSKAEDKLELKAEEVLHPTDRLPEFVNNTGKVTQNFEYYSQGPFTIYPMYTITGNEGNETALGERIGIYIVDETGKKGDTQWVWQPLNNDSYDWIEAYNVYDGNWSGVKDPKSFFEYLQDNKVFMDKCTRIRTEGITINIPKGTRFGFVIDAAGGGPYYSNSEYNGDLGSPYRGPVEKDGINDTYAATFIYDDMLYLAFEDWAYSDPGHDNDFNDVVFRFKDDITRPLIIDKDVDDNPMQYIVACEDLGGSFDWDFNDVVYGIEHVSGQTTARIKLLAAGGTLPVHITYDNKDIYFDKPSGGKCTDLHQAFGVEQDVPVNVGIYQTEAVYSDPFNVDPNAFSVSTDARKFKIHVSYKDGSEAAEIGVPSKKGMEPQAFLVADPNWKWPNEFQNIKSKYSDFPKWVEILEEKGWCGSVWGLKSTSAGDNLLEIPYAVSFEGNVATANLPNQAFPEENKNNEYIITVLAKADAVLTFEDPSGHPLQVVVDGSIKANQRTFFTLSPDVTKKIRDFNNNGDNCKMKITFANGVVAKDMLVELSNRVGKDVVSASKLDPKLTANEIVMKYGQDYTVEYSSNSRGACTFESLNTNVLRVDDRGNLTRVAIGKTTIVVTQAAYGDYKEAVTYVPVIVEGDYRNPDLSASVAEPIAVGDTIGRFYLTPELNNEPYVYNTVVTSTDTTVARASLNGNWLSITGVSAGCATITLKQPKTIQYYESTLEVPVEVIRRATAKTITYVGGGDNGSWNSTTSLYKWTTTTYNLLQVFTLDENEIDKYKGFCFTVSDPTFKDGGNYRVVLTDASGNHVAKIEKLEGKGTRTFYFNAADSPNDNWNNPFKLEDGRKLSEVRQIMVGGGGTTKVDGTTTTTTGSGELKLTNCYLVNK